MSIYYLLWQITVKDEQNFPSDSYFCLSCYTLQWNMFKITFFKHYWVTLFKNPVSGTSFSQLYRLGNVTQTLLIQRNPKPYTLNVLAGTYSRGICFIQNCWRLWEDKKVISFIGISLFWRKLWGWLKICFLKVNPVTQIKGKQLIKNI